MVGKYVLLIAGILALASCRKGEPQVTGCTDPAAYNYNKDANVPTVCHYYAERYAGTYNVTDTLIDYLEDSTRRWYDTVISSFSITAIAYGRDSLEFDTLLCLHCNTWTINAYADSFVFSDLYYHYPVNSYQIGRIDKDTLRYQAGLEPMTIGYRRIGTGIRQH